MTVTRLIITRGLPASGKTTWARKWLAEGEQETHPNRARVNRDELRFALFGRYWPVDEPTVTAAQRAAVRAHLKAGRSVVVDDTNLRRKDAQTWADMARENDATFQLVDFTDVPLALCLERDRKRQAAGERFVGHDVIVEKYNRYLKSKPRDLKLNLGRQEKTLRTYVPDASSPTAYVVDIDGTLAQMNGRSPYDESRVSEDLFVDAVGSLVLSLSRAGHGIVVMSGRTEGCRAATEKWLKDNGVRFNQLVMRREGDRRNDAIIKEELFFEYVAPVWQVLGAIDDRNRVVRMWRQIGLTCFQVAEGDF